MTRGKPLAGKVSIVTGASQGIGRAIAQELARLGSHLALSARTEGPLQAVAGESTRCGVKTLAVVADVRNRPQCDALIQRALEEFGHVDILVNNAGIGRFAPVHELSDDDWERVMTTNVRGIFYCSRAVIPHMIARRTGHIINISSLAGKNGIPGGAVYCASKFAVMGLSYSMAEDLRGYGIRVAVVCPGSVHTEFSPHEGKDPRKMLQPEDVARVVGFLVTQEAQSFVSEVLIRPTQKP